jgi:hypothetical protein
MASEAIDEMMWGMERAISIGFLMPHRLLIYHPDTKLYEKILSKRLPQLKIHSAMHPEEELDFIKETEIILSWQIPDEVLKRAKHLRGFRR